MRKYLILIIFITICISIYAQSIFSQYGPAEINYQRDAYDEGMGGTGIGDMFRKNPSLANPALSTTYDFTNFSTALNMGSTTFKDINSNTFEDDQVYLPYFSIIFPLKNHRFGFHYQNISSGNLSTELSRSTTLGGEQYEYTEVNTISKSLFQAGVFYAHKNDLLNFGIGLNYLFGHEIEFYKQEFRSGDLIDSRYEETKTFKSPSVTIGFSKIIDNMSTGLAFSTPVKLEGDSFFSSNILNEEKSDATSFKYPASISLGITNKVYEFLHVSTDFDYQLWENTSNFENSVNTMRLGVGLAWTGINRSDRFYARIPVRAGLSYRNLPFEINDNRVTETAYYLGVSIPLKQNNSYLDLAFKFFSRGDASKHDYEEDGLLFTIGTQGFDLFRRPDNRKRPRDIPKPERGF